MYLYASLVLALSALGLGATTPNRRSISSGPNTGASRFSRDDVSIAEAPLSHQLVLGRERRPAGVGRRLPAHIARQLGGSEVINTIYSGVYPTANVTWGDTPKAGGGGDGGQKFTCFVDTGSADTWVVSRQFQCVNVKTGKPQNQSQCGFGPGLDTGLASFVNLTDQEFSVGYFPENVEVQGSFGLAPITVGGVTVPRQQVALVESAAWNGDGITSGLMGLAYPAITSSSNRTTGFGVQYDPWFTTAVKQGLVQEAVFTLALDRVPPGTPVSADAGMAAFGGLVPESYYKSPFTSVPIEPETVGGSEVFAFYSVMTKLVYRTGNGSMASAGEFRAIVDSGTAPNFVPISAAEDLNAQFRPPAVYNVSLGFWTVPCDATAPYAAFVLGDVEMAMDPRDMIVRSLNGLPGYENVCFSAFNGTEAYGGTFSGIIGEVWQRSYVVAYDQGRSMMHFAQRMPY